MSSSPALRIGLISDTHGLLRPQALDAMRGSDHIVHAGDVGDREILDALAELAPVTAVRGNNDLGKWARALRQTECITIGQARIYVIHDLGELGVDPVQAGIQAVISGHSHRPKSDCVRGVLYVNPGSAGPRRFSLPVSVGHLLVAGGKVSCRLQELDCMSVKER